MSNFGSFKDEYGSEKWPMQFPGGSSTTTTINNTINESDVSSDEEIPPPTARPVENIQVIFKNPEAFETLHRKSISKAEANKKRADIERKRAETLSNDTQILQQISRLRLSLSDASQLLIHPLINPLTTRPTLSTGTYSPIQTSPRYTSDLRYITPPTISTTIPSIITSLRGFSQPSTTNALRLSVLPTNQRPTLFDLNFITSKPNNLDKILVDWLEIPDSLSRSGLWQHGVCRFDFDREPNVTTLNRKVRFSQSFPAPPHVIMMITGLHTTADKPLRINAGFKISKESGKKLHRHGFSMEVSTWGDSPGLHGVEVSWIAYDRALKGVHSGFVGTDDFRTEEEPQHYNTRYTEFPAGKFTKAPKVMLGLTRLSLNAPGAGGVNVACSTSHVTERGMCWNGNTWGGTVGYGVGMGYLAIEE
ncbi:hypothetical protein BJ508DRAFT_335302 [Ascobolus immersus RN42]|uniref:H-type lectin domain-containing protein n=1 Tax=Ascobolus immersus RN42 TaxID=1160509 RepID=A0A3N4HJ04_ASCIM|nr:hypothetical protein BJ508DRAFT_335302 [Ascobolus immersus RN42]